MLPQLISRRQYWHSLVEDEIERLPVMAVLHGMLWRRPKDVGMLVCHEGRDNAQQRHPRDYEVDDEGKRGAALSAHTRASNIILLPA